MEERPILILNDIPDIETPNYPKINTNEFFPINKIEIKIEVKKEIKTINKKRKLDEE